MRVAISDSFSLDEGPVFHVETELNYLPAPNPKLLLCVP